MHRSAPGRRQAVVVLALVLVMGSVPAQARSEQQSFDAAYVAQTAFDVLGSGTARPIAVTYRNTGQRAWVRATDSEVALAVCAADKVTCGVPSPYAAWALDWDAASIYARQQTDWVLPGELGLFLFSIRGPDGVPPGTRIRLHGELVLVSTGQAVRASGYYHDVVTPYRVGVSMDATAVAAGDSAQFRARVLDGSGRRLPGARTGWSVIGPGEIDQFGVLTILPDAAGSVTVVARSGDTSSEVRVLILAPPPGSIEISPRVASLTAGTSTTFRATVLDVTGSIVRTRKVVWTASGSGSITPGGTFTAGTGPGSAVVTARLGEVTASTTITIRSHAPLRTPAPPSATPPASPSPAPSPTPASTAVPAPSPTSAPAATATPSATAAPTPTPGQQPSPTLSPTAAPTSAASPSPSPTTAASPSPTPSPSQSPTSSPAPTPTATPVPTTSPPSPSAGEVIVTPLLATIDSGETEAFAAIVLDLLGVQIVGATVTWSASGAGTIDASGVFRASDDPSGGTATVTATSGGVLGTASVVIEPRVPATVVIGPQTATISPGDLVVFSAKVFDQNSKQLTTATVHWSVSGAGTIDASGRYTAPADAAGGLAQVTATSGTAGATATVTVEPDPPADPDLLPGL